MKQYLDLLDKILKTGERRTDRTGVGTVSIFGTQTRYDLAKGFPLLTTKKIFLKAVIYELLWFLAGDTNVKFLNKRDVHIWDDWADQAGELGPIYGKQWTAWEAKDGTKINQIKEVIKMIKKSPESRRILVSGWNVGDLQMLIRQKKTAPPPCHTLFQFYVSQRKQTLSCQLYQRSADIFLGVPFNIASYSLLTLMMAQVCGLKPGEFIHTTGDTHIYKNHLKQVKLQLRRRPRRLPKMKLNSKINDIFKFRFEDFELIDYHPHPAIPAPIAV